MRHTTINIPSPCHESWAAMKPVTGTGRHCARCQETVVDFTRMTDAEVVAFLHRYPAISCGRFRESQMRRPLLAAAQPIAGWRRWVGATVALLGLGSLPAPKAQAQAASPIYWGGPQPKNITQAGSAAPSTTAIPNSVAPEPLVAVEASPFIIEGIVHNANGSPVVGIKVELSSAMEEALFITTDANGHFQFAVNKDELGEYVAVSVYRRARLGLYHQADVAEIDIAHPQLYHLYLKGHLKRHRRSAGKFR